MARITLLPDERLIADAMASNVKKLLVFPQPNPGRLNITNKRVIFNESKLKAEFEYPLEEIKSFSVGAAKAITLHLNSGDDINLTGMYNKKFIDALQQAGVHKE